MGTVTASNVPNSIMRNCEYKVLYISSPNDISSLEDYLNSPLNWWIDRSETLSNGFVYVLRRNTGILNQTIMDGNTGHISTTSS